jgi:hypothetical protein
MLHICRNDINSEALRSNFHFLNIKEKVFFEYSVTGPHEIGEISATENYTSNDPDANLIEFEGHFIAKDFPVLS